jgi:tryptophan synthase alpha chain
VSRLKDCFARAKAGKRAALVIYLTAQDPDDETSRRLMCAAAEAGADIIEVGVPWSDPSADGKAIQAAIHRALAAGGGMTKSLALCRALRKAHPDVGIVLFGYANPIIVMGAEAFAAAAREAGADGVLCVDYPADEDPELTSALRTQGLDFVPLLAPTSTPAGSSITCR